MRTTAALAIVSLSLFGGIQSAHAVTFEWATVGNPGNADVEDIYRISKHEATNAQYIEFLNAVATVGDA